MCQRYELQIPFMRTHKRGVTVNAKKQTLLALLSMLGSVDLWAAVTDAWGYSALFSGHLLDGGKYLYGYLSRMVWMFPAFLLIHRFDADLVWSGRQMFSRPKAEPVFVVFLVLTTIYALALKVVHGHPWPAVREDILPMTIKYLIVGIGEETVFRGWAYNLLRKVRSDAVSLLLSSLGFVLLHWPAYFIRLFLSGQFDLAGLVTQSVSVLFCGLLFAVMLERSGTLWDPIIAHFYYDWMLEVFI